MCLEPVSLTRELAGRKFTLHVPCNGCDECTKDKQNEYVLRSIEEGKKRGNVWFFTLTYNEDSVPQFDYDGEIIEDTGELTPGFTVKTLYDKDVTTWKKRVRRRLNYHRNKEGLPNLDFSFMICGEYGPRTHRPHYHGLFIGLDNKSVMEFKKDWESHFGFTCFKYVPSITLDGRSQIENTARYCSKYICKLKSFEDENVIDGYVNKPHKMVSPGFGLPKDLDRMKRYHLGLDLYDYDPNNLSGLNRDDLNKIVDTIKRRRKFTNNGRDYKLPNYYKRKIFYYQDDWKSQRALQISKMVSKSLQMDIQKDFARQCVDVATRESLGETPEALCYAAKCVSKAEKDYRVKVAETIQKNNLKYMQKSRF